MRNLSLLNLAPETFNAISGIVSGKLNPADFVGGAARVAAWKCVNPPDREDVAMEAIDTLLETCGVEYIASADDSFSEAQGMSYCNTGDTYGLTILYDHRSGKFSVGCWGDVVERDPRRFG